MNAPKNLVYYLIVFGIFAGLKFLFAALETEELTFLLYPLDFVVSILTGSSSVFQIGIGYFHQDLNIIIDKSCSGYNLWLLSFLMLSFLAIPIKKSIAGKLGLILLCFGASFILALLINSFRIYTSIFAQQYTFLQGPTIHEAIGIFINLSFLIILYLFTEKLLYKTKFQ
ncbi:MAG: exosortase K [Bacteroidota bacterium]